MRVSVIVPLYNKAPTIERTLASILGQTLEDFEVIVVDDGSTDGGADLVERCGDSRVRLLHQANAGPGAARNRGIEAATSPFVAFLDADDEWLPGFLQLGVAQLADSTAATFTAGYFLEPQGAPTKTLWTRRGIEPGVQRLDPELAALAVVHRLAYMTPCTTLARTETVRRWGGFYDGNGCVYGEDAHLWLKVLLNESVIFSHEPLARIHTEASVLSHRRHARPIEPFLIQPELIEESCPEYLQELLAEVLAVRASKTACMLAYWGKWREARALLNRFVAWSHWRLPFVRPAMLAGNPIGAGAGKILRMMRAG